MRDTPPYLTSLDLSRRWQVTPDRVRQLARAGRITPALITTSGVRLFNETGIAAYEAERRRQREAGILR